jgi:hypothetical protein
LRLLFVVLALAVLAAGCKVDALVTVDVHKDGSGVVTLRVTLDPAAVQAADAGGGKLEDRVRLADLTAAGWTVQPWVHAGDGSAAITMSKPFNRPDEVAGIIHEISGDVGPLRDFRVTRDRGLISTRYDATGSIDLSTLQTGITADPALVGNLTNQQVDVSALDQALLDQIRQSLTVRVVVKLPNGTTTYVGRSGKKVAVDTSTSVLDSRRIALAAAAVVLLLAALAVLFVGRRRGRRQT